MSYDRVMIDLESMGRPPYGAIVAIGAAMFNLETGEMGPTFYRTVHLSNAMSWGMQVDGATVLFWLRQPDAARNAIAYNGIALDQALEEFKTWLLSFQRLPDIYPYGNGSSFDLSILSNAYELCDIERPWIFANERCFRTIRNQYQHVVPYDPETKPGVAHNAVDDSVFQINHLFKIKEALRARK